MIKYYYTYQFYVVADQLTFCILLVLILTRENLAYGASDEIFAKLIQEHRYEQVKMLCVDMRGLTGTIGAEDMHTLVNEILQQILYKKYELLINYKERYLSGIQTLNHSIKKYIEAA